MIKTIAHRYKGGGPEEFPDCLRCHMWMAFTDKKPFVWTRFMELIEVKIGQYIVWHATGLLTVQDKLGEDQ